MAVKSPRGPGWGLPGHLHADVGLAPGGEQHPAAQRLDEGPTSATSNFSLYTSRESPCCFTSVTPRPAAVFRSKATSSRPFTEAGGSQTGR